MSGKVRGQEATSPIESRTLDTLRGISRSYGSTKALSECSFDIRSSKIHALVGANGSGKSTFVKLLSGVLSPDGGRIGLIPVN